MISHFLHVRRKKRKKGGKGEERRKKNEKKRKKRKKGEKEKKENFFLFNLLFEPKLPVSTASEASAKFIGFLVAAHISGVYAIKFLFHQK